MKSKYIIGYAVYSPALKEVVLGTIARNRSKAIELAGCINKKAWMELYRRGFKTVKVCVNY